MRQGSIIWLLFLPALVLSGYDYNDRLYRERTARYYQSIATGKPLPPTKVVANFWKLILTVISGMSISLEFDFSTKNNIL